MKPQPRPYTGGVVRGEEGVSLFQIDEAKAIGFLEQLDLGTLLPPDRVRLHTFLLTLTDQSDWQGRDKQSLITRLTA